MIYILNAKVRFNQLLNQFIPMHTISTKWATFFIFLTGLVQAKGSVAVPDPGLVWLRCFISGRNPFAFVLLRIANDWWHHLDDSVDSVDSFWACWRAELHALAMAMLVVTVTTAVTAVTATSHSCKLSFALQLGQLKLEHLQPLCWNPLVVVSSLRIQRTLHSGGSVTAAQSSYLQRRWWLLVWTKVPRVQQFWWNRREKRWRNFIFSMSTTGKALRTSPWKILSKLQNCPGGLWWSENSSTARGLTFTMATSWKLWGLISLRWTCNPSSCMRLVSFKGRISQIQHGPWNGVQILTLIECFHLLLSMQSWLCSKTQTNAVTIRTTNFQREPTGRVPFLFWMLQLRQSLLWMFCMRNHLRKRIPIHGRDNRAAL